MTKKDKRTKAELDRLKDIAEDYYIRMGKTGREIADMLGITEQTVSNWKKGREGDRTWDDRKRDNQLTPLKLKETLMREANSIAEGNDPAIKADALSKIMAAINAIDKTVNPRTVMAVLQMLDNYTADIDPAFAIRQTEIHKQFLQHVIALES